MQSQFTLVTSFSTVGKSKIQLHIPSFGMSAMMIQSVFVVVGY